jgi:CRP/FNR family cyclic AMP-dependent transcriptional regulator
MMDAKEALARSEIFAALEGGSLDALARAATVRRFTPGELVVKEGDEAVSFYVVCQGQLEVVKGSGQNKERVVATLNPGDFFGEMALLDGFPRGASVRAAGECECLVLTRWDFLGEVRTNIKVALAILPVLSCRLRECEEQLLP